MKLGNIIKSLALSSTFLLGSLASANPASSLARSSAELVGSEVRAVVEAALQATTAEAAQAALVNGLQGYNAAAVASIAAQVGRLWTAKNDVGSISEADLDAILASIETNPSRTANLIASYEGLAEIPEVYSVEGTFGQNLAERTSGDVTIDQLITLVSPELEEAAGIAIDQFAGCYQGACRIELERVEGVLNAISKETPSDLVDEAADSTLHALNRGIFGKQTPAGYGLVVDVLTQGLTEVDAATGEIVSSIPATQTVVRAKEEFEKWNDTTGAYEPLSAGIAGCVTNGPGA